MIPMFGPDFRWGLVPNDETPTDYWRAIREMMVVTLKGASSAG